MTREEFATKKAEFEAMRKEYNKILSNTGLDMVLAAFGKVFDAHPLLESVTWRQFTPYFNDGDECVFDVHRDNFDVVYDGGSEFELDSWTSKESFEKYFDAEDAKVPTYALYKELFDGCSSALNLFDDDELQVIFGDHISVTILRNSAGEVVSEMSVLDHD